jgi:uncharacterized membrane protein
MNAAQIHLALNHAPIFLSIIGGVILILGLIRKNESFKTIALYMLVAAALFTAPVFLTGEGTEELIENLPGVNEGAIEEHEEMAKIAMILIAVTGAVALFGLFLKKNETISKFVFGAAVILSLASFGTMAQTAHLGGLIRHSELQNGTAGNNEKEGTGEKEDEKKNENNNPGQEQDKAVKDSLKKAERTIKRADDDD